MDNALLLSPIEAGGEGSEPFEGAVHRLPAAIGGSQNEEGPLVGDLLVPGTGAVKMGCRWLHFEVRHLSF